MKSRVLGIVFLVTAVATVAGYCLTLTLRSDLTFGRWSFAYLVLVVPSSVVRSFPAHRPASDVRYEYDAADGPAPARISLTFESLAGGDEVLAAYGRYCSDHGFHPAERPEGLNCRAPGYEIAVEVRAESRRNLVVVVFEEEN